VVVRFVGDRVVGNCFEGHPPKRLDLGDVTPINRRLRECAREAPGSATFGWRSRVIADWTQPRSDSERRRWGQTPWGRWRRTVLADVRRGAIGLPGVRLRGVQAEGEDREGDRVGRAARRRTGFVRCEDRSVRSGVQSPRWTAAGSRRVLMRA
jgi:hypothetical protein